MTEQVTQEQFWGRLDDVQAGMLNVADGRPVPMSHYCDREERALYFITARGTDLESALRSGPASARYILASGSDKLYATITGTAYLVDDQAKLDEIWNVVADAWFDEGEDDKDVALVKVDLSEAEIWTTTGKLGFLYEIVKAQATDRKPDMGNRGVLHFAA